MAGSSGQRRGCSTVAVNNDDDSSNDSIKERKYTAQPISISQMALTNDGTTRTVKEQAEGYLGPYQIQLIP